MKDRGSLACCRVMSVGLVLTTLAGLRASAETIALNPVAADTALDDGPQDGVFDAFVALGLGGVNNNGYTSVRTALEFDLSAIPSGSTIDTATLTLAVGWVEGTREVALHGYPGDGTVQLADFAADGLVDQAVLAPFGSYSVTFEVQDFVEHVLLGGEAFAGFNVREDPANPMNFAILYFVMAGPIAPLLTVEFTPPSVAGVGGSVTGISPVAGRAFCRNWTSGRTVFIDMRNGARSWDCEQAGLAISPGDIVTMHLRVTGPADARPTIPEPVAQGARE